MGFLRDQVSVWNGTSRFGGILHSGHLDRVYGPTWFLDNVAQATILPEDLQKMFGGNLDTAQDALALTCFLDSRSHTFIEKWQRLVKASSAQTLTSSCITRPSHNITEQNRMHQFTLHMKRMSKDEYCAVDSTPMPIFEFHLVNIYWSRNKEHIPMTQTLEVIVYSNTSHLPIYNLELPGNMLDSRTAEMIITELEHAGFRNIILITNRRYESLKNLEVYIAKS